MCVFPFTSFDPCAPGVSGLLQEQHHHAVSGNIVYTWYDREKGERGHILLKTDEEWRVPVRCRRGDVAVVKSSMPGEQDDASVAKHTVQEQLEHTHTHTQP